VGSDKASTEFCEFPREESIVVDGVEEGVSYRDEYRYVK